MADNIEPQLPGELDLDFTSDSNKLYKGSFNINPVRWERVLAEIPFEDLVQELTGQTGNSQDKIVCPIHGDSDASFQIYKRSNSGFCFGCPPGRNYYDHINFTTALTGMSRVKALAWLEKKWDLPPLADVRVEHDEEDEDEDEEEQGVTIQLQFGDLVEPYLRKAELEVQQAQDPELAAEYASIYFDAHHLMDTAKQAKQEYDDPEDGLEEARQLEMQAALMLARVVGKKTIERILAKKY